MNILKECMFVDWMELKIKDEVRDCKWSKTDLVSWKANIVNELRIEKLWIFKPT